MDQYLYLKRMHAFEDVRAIRCDVERPTLVPVRTRTEWLLLFVTRGELVIRAGRDHTQLHPREACLIGPSRLKIFIECLSAAELYVVRFHQNLSSGSMRRLVVTSHSTVLQPMRLTHILRRIIDESRKREPSRAVLHYLVLLTLCELAGASQPNSTEDIHEAGLESIASRVDAYIAAHYQEPLSTPDIAHELHYNAVYLERAYRSERKIPIRKAILVRRMKEAQALLRSQGGKRVAEIASLCGYSDPGYFRQVFKRFTETTPHAYRTVNGSPAIFAEQHGPRVVA